jgi:hypothetical protein
MVLELCDSDDFATILLQRMKQKSRFAREFVMKMAKLKDVVFLTVHGSGANSRHLLYTSPLRVSAVPARLHI